MGDLKKSKQESSIGEHRQPTSEEEVIKRLHAYMKEFYANQLKKKESEKLLPEKTKKYKGYLIAPAEKNRCRIYSKNGALVYEEIADVEECEWIIDKETATEKQVAEMKKLYDMDIYILSGLFIEYMQKKENEGLTIEEEEKYEMVRKIRKRKSKNKEY